MAQDAGFGINAAPFGDSANHGDGGVPGIQATLIRIVQTWKSVESVTKCDCCEDVNESILRDFGRILHAVQDLYSHSNYVEVQSGGPTAAATVGTLPLWGMFGQPGNTPQIPPGITSGNYSWPFDNGAAPTHAQMNHDAPSTPAGGVTNMAGVSMFVLANDLATRHTTAMWNALSSQMAGSACWAKLLQCCNPKAK